MTFPSLRGLPWWGTVYQGDIMEKIEKITVVRYQATEEAAEENSRLIEHVFAELNADRPEGLRYAAFRMADGVTFVHIAVTEEGGGEVLAKSPAFAEFQRDGEQRRAVTPTVDTATMVGSYGFFGE